MSRPRVLIAGLFHETHTFLDEVTGLDQFQDRFGDEFLACKGDGSPLGGVLEAAEKLGWNMLPAIDLRAQPSGIVADDVFKAFCSTLLPIVEELVSISALDAIYLVLHGAMATPLIPDVEGKLLQRLRRIAGVEGLPIFGVFDLHANFSQAMAQHADCLVAYRHNPHTDACAMAIHAAELLDEHLLVLGRGSSAHYWRHAGIIWPPTGTGTADTPMFELEALARKLEIENDVLSVNVVGGFSFADTPDTGVSFTVVTRGGEAHAQSLLDQLCQLAWELREAGNKVDPPLDEVLGHLRASAEKQASMMRRYGSEQELLAANDSLDTVELVMELEEEWEFPIPDHAAEGIQTVGQLVEYVQRAFIPTILVEPSDNIGGGAPGDGTGLLRALVANDIRNSAVCLCDPEAAAALQHVQLGERVTLPLGGKGSRLDEGPLLLEVELVSRSDGHFALEDRQSHLATMYGDHFNMGPCAVVRHGGITILLTSIKTPPFDLGQWRSQGIEPAKLAVIGVKAAVAHRRAYDPIAARMLWVDTPGPCRSDLRKLPYRHVRRPVYPLDADEHH